MDCRRYVLCALLFLCWSWAWAQQDRPAAVADPDPGQAKILQDGARVMKEGRPQDAIAEYFDKVLAYFDGKYGASKKRVYCARTSQEGLSYLLQVSADNAEGKGKGDAIVLPPIWSDAHYLKAFALLELKRLPEARFELEAAVAMSPANAQYLAELAYTYQLTKNNKRALELYGKAVEAAKAFSPLAAKTFELTRSLRGMGYVLVELGQLDEAEKKYQESLAADPNDQNAKSELAYIKKVRAK